MKKGIALLLSLLMLAGAASGCSGNQTPSGSDAGGGTSAAQNENTEPPTPSNSICWVNEEHTDIFEYGEQLYDEAHPEAPLELSLEFYPVTEMHNKLLIALQSGVGAPDIVDINLTLVRRTSCRATSSSSRSTTSWSLSSITWCSPASISMQRTAPTTASRRTWAPPSCSTTWTSSNPPASPWRTLTPSKRGISSSRSGRKVKDATGLAWTAYETLNQRPYWPLLNECGLDYIDENGEVIMDSPENIEVLEWMYDVFQEGLAVAAPGGDVINESFYNWMNGGNCASVLMPSWYMVRLMDYMPDLSGKIDHAPRAGV